MSVAELINILDRRRLIFPQFKSLSRNDKAEGAIERTYTISILICKKTQKRGSADYAQVLIYYIALTCSAGIRQKQKTPPFGESMPDQYEIARQQWHMKWPSMRKSALIRCAGSPKSLLLRVRQNGRSRRSIPFAGGMMFDASRARFENCLGMASTPDAQNCGLSDVVGLPVCIVCSRVLTPIHREKLAES